VADSTRKQNSTSFQRDQEEISACIRGDKLLILSRCEQYHLFNECLILPFFFFNLVWKSVVYVQNSMYISISFCNDIWLPYSPAEGPNSGICDVLVDNMCPRWVWCKMVIKLWGNLPHLHNTEKHFKWVGKPYPANCDICFSSINFFICQLHHSNKKNIISFFYHLTSFP
jgi:hypothetical protein